VRSTFTIPPGQRRALVVRGNVEVEAFTGQFTLHSYSGAPIAYVKVHKGRARSGRVPPTGTVQVLTLDVDEMARVGPGLLIERVDPDPGWLTVIK
jgi:hypothetical protein